METTNKNYNKKKFLNEKYQTILIELSIDELFEMKKADNNIDEKDFPKEYLDLKNLLKELNKYDKMHIIEKINNSWMYDIEIDLNIEIKKYNEVLKILINLVKKRKKYFIDNKEMYKEEMLNLLKLFVNKQLIKNQN